MQKPSGRKSTAAANKYIFIEVFTLLAKQFICFAWYNETDEGVIYFVFGGDHLFKCIFTICYI